MAHAEYLVRNQLQGHYNLEEKQMYFWRSPCEADTHEGDNCLEKVPIRKRNISTVRNLIAALIYILMDLRNESIKIHWDNMKRFLTKKQFLLNELSTASQQSSTG